MDETQVVEHLVLWLIQPQTRDQALLELSKRRETFPDLACYLWHSFGAIAVLLQEIAATYPMLSPPAVAAHVSNRVCNALALLQCVASHSATRIPFLQANLPVFLYPFLAIESKARPLEYLRLTSLGVIGALVKADETPVISFLLGTEIVPLCLKVMEIGTELSKTVATFIMQKILLDDVRDRYRDLKKSFSMELSRPVTKDGGFEVSIPKSWRSDVQTSSTGFYPPSHVRIQQNHHNGGTTILALYSTPTVPGWTRHVGMQLLKKAPDSSAKGSGIAFFGLPLPRWLAHLAGALFLHQDMVFLHHQERTVARDQAERLQRAAAAAAAAGSSSAGQQQQGGQQGATAAAATAGAGGDGRMLPPPKYYMPTSVDTGVTAWRHWLATFSDGDVPWAPGTPPLGPRERDPAKLFDTWHTHTSKCTVCLAALERMRLVRTVAVAAAAAAILAATVTAAARAAAAASAAAAAAAAAGATAAGAAAAVGSSGGLWGAIAAAAQAFACGEVGVLALVAALAAAVAAVTVKLEALMHRYDYNHADNV